MHEFALIQDLALIWLVALITGHICIRLRLPVMAGYMLAGILVGPHVLKLINHADQIRVLSEFGVAMLLFALGVDLRLRQVLSSAQKIVAAGLLQMILTIAAGWSLACWSGLATTAAAGLLFGCVCAVSSSVVMSRMLQDRGEVDSIHGQILIPLSLVQDLSLVIIIPFLPVLQQSSGSLEQLVISAGKALLFMLVVIVGATRIVPPVLAKAAMSNTREIFLLTLLVLCLAVALLSERLGLSIALGAFLAGLMMSESKYAHQALHDVAPLKDLFSIVFFVSIGMLLDPIFIANHWLEVLAFVVVLVAGKAVIGSIAALAATKSLRSAALVGIGLAQIGEFSFVLLTLGYASKLIPDAMYNLFFAGAVITMIASPAVMDLAAKLILRRIKVQELPDDIESNSGLKDHVIVCGYGRIGRNLGVVLEAHQIPFLVVELNATIVEDLAVRGIPHLYGDAMNPGLLLKANLKQASSLVLTMPDPFSATAVATFAREKNPNIKIVARAHRTDDIRIFRTAGVNAVVQPEFEASIEITRLVLNSLNRPTSEVHRALEQIRTMRYAIFQPDIEGAPMPQAPPWFGEDQMGIWFPVNSQLVAGQSIRDLNIRHATGATITAVRRAGNTIAFPDPAFKLEMDDEIYGVGDAGQLRDLEHVFGPNNELQK